MTRPSGRRGQALLGALAAVALSGLVGASFVVSYENFVKQSRRMYVQAALTNLDTKIRFMAMQPYAYDCGAINSTTGISGCTVDSAYFASVIHVPMSGVPCPVGMAPNSCGFALTIAPLKDAVIAGQATKLFSYQLKYEGTDFAIRPLGFDPSAAGVGAGLEVPTEILQAQQFDCAVIDPLKPVFSGFAVDGTPICQGFTPCPRGQYVTAIDPRTLTLTCAAPTNTMVDCSGGSQNRIASLTWTDGAFNGGGAGSCTQLSIPPLTAASAPVIVPTTAPSCPTGTAWSGTACVPATGTWRAIAIPGGNPMGTFLGPAAAPGPTYSQVHSAAVAAYGLLSGPADCPVGVAPPGQLLNPYTGNLIHIENKPCTTPGATCTYKLLLVPCLICANPIGWYANTSEKLVCQ